MTPLEQLKMILTATGVPYALVERPATYTDNRAAFLSDIHDSNPSLAEAEAEAEAITQWYGLLQQIVISPATDKFHTRNLLSAHVFYTAEWTAQIAKPFVGARIGIHFFLSIGGYLSVGTLLAFDKEGALLFSMQDSSNMEQKETHYAQQPLIPVRYFDLPTRHPVAQEALKAFNKAQVEMEKERAPKASRGFALPEAVSQALNATAAQLLPPTKPIDLAAIEKYSPPLGFVDSAHLLWKDTTVKDQQLALQISKPFFAHLSDIFAPLFQAATQRKILPRWQFNTPQHPGCWSLELPRSNSTRLKILKKILPQCPEATQLCIGETK